ncbi:MAG: IS1 family transposase [Acidobacteria bacterium]|nr:IS1 family transposase [Acidobacteriota bacterium]
MNRCPSCQRQTLVKAGLNSSGSQRYQCKVCKHYTTLQPKPEGYPAETRRNALRLYLEGNGLRRIGRLLEVTHQTVANWINTAQAHLPPAPPQPPHSSVIELDELYTFVGKKKTKSTW